MKTKIKHSKRKVLAWAVLDADGGIKNPSVSIFDTYKDAKKDADTLDKLSPLNNCKRDVVKCEIIY